LELHRTDIRDYTFFIYVSINSQAHAFKKVHLTRSSEETTREAFCEKKTLITLSPAALRLNLNLESSFEMSKNQQEAYFMSLDPTNCPIKLFYLAENQNSKFSLNIEDLVWISNKTQAIQFDLEKLSTRNQPFKFHLIARGVSKLNEDSKEIIISIKNPEIQPGL
jgi:hypothetical protein